MFQKLSIIPDSGLEKLNLNKKPVLKMLSNASIEPTHFAIKEPTYKIWKLWNGKNWINHNLFMNFF